MTEITNVVTVVGTCQEGHRQAIEMAGMSIEMATEFAALMDGTSRFYVASPRGTDSLIGKCGICGSQIDCKVESRPVDRAARTLVDGSPVTEDHREIDPATGQQKDYVVLTAEERAKGFVRPVRRTYLHVGIEPKMSGIVLVKPGKHGCGSRTTMALPIAETYAHDPGFYSGTFCCSCMTHRPLNEFVWEGTTEQVGT